MSRGEEDLRDSHFPKLKWETDLVREKERFEYYREFMGRYILNLTPERPAQGFISASIDVVKLDSCSVSRANLSPHAVRRTASDLARSSHDVYHLGFSYGRQLHKESRHGLRLRKADILYFSDSSVETKYSISQGPNVTLFFILFPKHIIDRRASLKLSDGFDLVYQSKSSALYNAVMLMNRRLSVGSVNELSEIGSAIGALLVAGLMEDAQTSTSFLDSDGTAKNGLAILAKETIDSFLYCDQLSLAFVARRLGISTRYLLKIFESRKRNISSVHFKQKAALHKAGLDGSAI